MGTANPLELLRQAMDLEREGMKFYSKASKCARDRKVAELFRRLSAEEGTHFEMLEQVHDHLARNNEWLVMKDLMEQGDRVVLHADIFASDVPCGELDDLAAIALGIKAEEDSIRFYREAFDGCHVGNKGGCEVFKWLVDFEREHLRTLTKIRRLTAGRSD